MTHALTRFSGDRIVVLGRRFTALRTLLRAVRCRTWPQLSAARMVPVELEALAGFGKETGNRWVAACSRLQRRHAASEIGRGVKENGPVFAGPVWGGMPNLGRGKSR